MNKSLYIENFFTLTRRCSLVANRNVESIRNSMLQSGFGNRAEHLQRCRLSNNSVGESVRKMKGKLWTNIETKHIPLSSNTFHNFFTFFFFSFNRWRQWCDEEKSIRICLTFFRQHKRSLTSKLIIKSIFSTSDVLAHNENFLLPSS